MLASPERTQPEMQPDDLIMSKVINFSLVSVSCSRFTNSFQACLICILSPKFDYFCPPRPFILSLASTFVLKNNLGLNNPFSFLSTDLFNKQPHNLLTKQLLSRAKIGTFWRARICKIQYDGLFAASISPLLGPVEPCWEWDSGTLGFRYWWAGPARLGCAFCPKGFQIRLCR